MNWSDNESDFPEGALPFEFQPEAGVLSVGILVTSNKDVRIYPFHLMISLPHLACLVIRLYLRQHYPYGTLNLRRHHTDESCLLPP
jgi:hypothetical protein